MENRTTERLKEHFDEILPLVDVSWALVTKKDGTKAVVHSVEIHMIEQERAEEIWNKLRETDLINIP